MVSRRKKYETKFPVARIKKLIQSDEQIGKLSSLTPFAIAKALELFLNHLMLDLFSLKHLTRETATACSKERLLETTDDEIEPTEETKKRRGRLTTSLGGPRFLKIMPNDLLELSMVGHPEIIEEQSLAREQGLSRESLQDDEHKNLLAVFTDELKEKEHLGYYWFLKDLILAKKGGLQGASTNAELNATGSSGGDIYSLINCTGSKKKAEIAAVVEESQIAFSPKKPRNRKKKIEECKESNPEVANSQYSLPRSTNKALPPLTTVQLTLEVPITPSTLKPDELEDEDYDNL